VIYSGLNGQGEPSCTASASVGEAMSLLMLNIRTQAMQSGIRLKVDGSLEGIFQ